MPDLIPPPQAVVADVGQFFIGWGMLDYALELAVWRIEGLTDDQGKVETEELGSGRLVKRIEQGMRMLPVDRKPAMIEVLKMLSVLLPVRIFLAHATILWSPSQGRLYFRKTSEHLPNGQMRLKAFSPRKVRRAADAANTTALKLLAATNGMGRNE